MKKTRVAAYCRVSTDNDDQANSLISQRKYFEEYIRSHEGWELIEVYYDDGISGTQTRKRDGFNRMISHAMNGMIDIILTKEVSRFSRNTVDTLEWTRKLRLQGIGVIFVTDGIDTRDADGELRLTLMASLAQEESRKTSIRVRWGQTRRMEEGVVFGRDLLGYRVCNGKLEIIEDEVPVVKAIFRKYVVEGKGTHVIARELTEEGMRPKRVKTWSNTTILRVLTNEKYVGDLCQKKTYTPDYLTHEKKYNRGAEKMVYIRDHHTPIISRELWDRTQEEMKRRTTSDAEKAKHSNRYWCSGRLRCGECGQHYVSRTKRLKSGEMYKGWRCFAAANHGKSKLDVDGNPIGCDNGSINDRSLQSCVAFCLEKIVQNKEEIRAEIQMEITQLSCITEKYSDTNVESKINMLEEKKRKIIDLVLDGIITRAEMKKQVEWYDNAIADLQTEIKKKELEQKKRKEQICGLHDYMAAINSILCFERSSNNETFYKEVLDRIVLFRGNTVIVYLKCLPFGFKLHIHAHGKGTRFQTDIDFLEYVEKTK